MSKLDDICDWNEGTLTKGYDQEELIEVLRDDTRRMVKDLMLELIGEYESTDDSSDIELSLERNHLRQLLRGKVKEL
jgi:hypothetical protein